MNKCIKHSIAAIILAVLFVVAAQLSQMYQGELQSFVLNAGMWGPLLYIVINMLSIIIAPLGSGFLVPIAANAFGPLLTVLYSVASWFFGAVIAFYLARRYGHGKIAEWDMCKRIRTMEAEMSEQKIWIVLVLLRMALPVDVLSYALGLFTTVSYRVFIWTTLIGIIPFAIIFSYASVLPMWYQAVAAGLCLMAFLSAIYFLLSYKTDKKSE